MGLLDDAIRQHLELKRRHGADPSEVARQEQEALGPPRRGTAAEEVELLERDELAPDEAELYDDEEAADEELLGQTPRDDEAVAEPTPVPAEPLAPSEPRADELREPEPEPRAQEPPRAATADQPTQTYDVADIPDSEAPGEAAPPAENDDERGEDVLEETPEFLQETPEHDRLWFEQKPPRDFDF